MIRLVGAILGAVLVGWSQIGWGYIDDWDQVLKKAVEPGIKDHIQVALVDYDLIAADSQFKAVLNQLKVFDINRLTSKPEKLTFWINAYNIGAVNMILKHHPTKSIRDIGGTFKSVWKMPALEIGGKHYSLNQIEHKILRKMDEPRIHFAIVCASLSCPDLLAEAYRPQLIDQQLDRQTTQFVTDYTKGVAIDRSNQTLRVSSIFKWFSADFKSDGGTKAFIAKYRGNELTHYKLDYLAYNWALNSSPGDKK